MRCGGCTGERLWRAGISQRGHQRYRCPACRRRLKGRYRPMRGFKARESAQTICAGHGFIRNLREGFYDLGVYRGDPRNPQAPRAMRAWQELTAALQTA